MITAKTANTAAMTLPTGKDVSRRGGPGDHGAGAHADWLAGWNAARGGGSNAPRRA
jgi:hypothetical protein